ncbi:MAG TPA: glutamine--tRNA ligase [Burkholderiaceae bacterium]|nr:glutamine--tRNA ligase [Burkholderiaceae bacterium]
MNHRAANKNPARSADAGRAPAATNFIRNIVNADLAGGRTARRHWNGRPGDGTFQAQGPLDKARIRTRFPPEPNGYLHIGHAKSICLNFGLAYDYGGQCHLRFDDTNPVKEDQEFVDAILESVRWLGYTWIDGAEEHKYHASDYFDELYRFAEYLVETGHAYVDELSADAIRESRGTLTEAGLDSPFRNRPRDESLRLFREMRAGRHAEGSRVLRARIDMASPNINLRDPVLYRIRFADHHQTGSRWCIYPMYDYAHPVSDALEMISHSICTLEFEDHRPFYDWTLERLVPVLRAPQWRAALELVESIAAQGVEARKEFALHCHNFGHKLSGSDEELRMKAMFARWDRDRPTLLGDLDDFFALLRTSAAQFSPLLTHALDERRPDPFELPHQYEFSRLNLGHVVLSKRKLLPMVEEKLVAGWDDPRMPTIVGLRRRGYTAASLKLFAERIGVSKSDSWIDYAVLEQALRDDLDPQAPRAVAVLDPVRLVITNLPAGTPAETCIAPVHQNLPQLGTRELAFGRELWIERDDFAEHPPKDYFRLFPGNLVRLRYAYVVRCTGCDKDDAGNVTTVYVEYLPETRSGTPGASSVKVKGAIHWLSVDAALAAEIRLYDRLFVDAHPDAGGREWRDGLNPDSRRVVSGFVEAGLGRGPTAAQREDRYQFERHGYFVADRVDHEPQRPVFNRIATLKDSWHR